MAVNPTVVLTFFLLFLMMGAGLLSGTWGYSLGRQALRGITQPDSSPSRQLGHTEASATEASSGSSREKNMTFMDEAALIEGVKARISGKAEPSATPPSPSPVSAAPPSPTDAIAVTTSSSGADDAPESADNPTESIAADGLDTADPALLVDTDASSLDEQPESLSSDPSINSEPEPFRESESFLNTEPSPTTSP